MSGPDELIDRYCAVWGETDARGRADKLDTVWAHGATYTDPTVHAAGAEELLAHIAGVQKRRPNSKVVRTTGVDVHHAIGLFSWQAVDACGAMLRQGIDIVFFSADGAKIDRVIGFFTR
ncbi:MAG: hypothetical protein JO172_11660 [Hyphomicrobiales bacterium]|nr:hypothetical protein [Hyphomicrobiales bacterium]